MATQLSNSSEKAAVVHKHDDHCRVWQYPNNIFFAVAEFDQCGYTPDAIFLITIANQHLYAALHARTQEEKTLYDPHVVTFSKALCWKAALAPVQDEVKMMMTWKTTFKITGIAGMQKFVDWLLSKRQTKTVRHFVYDQRTALYEVRDSRGATNFAEWISVWLHHVGCPRDYGCVAQDCQYNIIDQIDECSRNRSIEWIQAINRKFRPTRPGISRFCTHRFAYQRNQFIRKCRQTMTRRKIAELEFIIPAMPTVLCDLTAQYIV